MKIELEEKKYWIWFSLITNLGFQRKSKLLEICKHPKNIYHLRKEQLEKIKYIGEKTSTEIVKQELKIKMEEQYNYMQKKNIDIIPITDDRYPTQLKNIYDPPLYLYYKGNHKILNHKSIAIIGCRQASEYGIKIAKYFAYHLSKQGFCIVSGLAKGIDTYAHIGTIYAKEKTIGVVGNGLDTVYPYENQKLADKIIQTDGCLISEYPIGTKPNKMNFPERNRIVSGLCDAIIVVEAQEKSGTLITVDFALEQGREVYVVPGNIDTKNSRGTNHLIKQGAKIITNYEDIMEDFQWNNK